MTVDLDALELHPVRIPMRHRFRRVDHRECVLIKGPMGWGEFSPFLDYPPRVTARWLEAALELANTVLPEPKRSSVPVNVTVPAVAPDVAAAIVIESGAGTAKVKIGEPGQTASDDVDRLSAVRSAIGSSGKVRVDVNAAWDLGTATTNLERLAEFDLEYAEQPVATIEEMVELRRRVAVKIAADEVVRQSADPLEVFAAGAADIVILKVQPMGGVTRTLELARRAGVPAVISSALETSVGMYGGLLAAALLDDLPYACGLGTVSLLEGDPSRDPLIPNDGVLEVRRPDPDPDLLDRWKPDRDTAARMLRRVRAAAEVLR
jgi:O-succinylbenzoate synthase